VYDPFGSGAPTGIGCVFLSTCIFLYTRVFYRCPTTSVAPRLKNTCRPGRKFFQFQNHYRPCVDHNAVRATPDCVHRVTVLCAVPCALSLVCDHLGVRSTCAVGPAHAVPHCSTVFYCVLLCPTVLYSSPAVLCSVLCWSYVSCRRPMVGNGGQWQVLSQIGGLLPMLTNTPDQTKNHVVLHVSSPTKPYQEYRYPVLAVRKPLVHLAWRRCPYQCLPHDPPGSTAVLVHLYQSLPAAELNTHTMISSILFYILIVGLLAYASYLKHQIRKR